MAVFSKVKMYMLVAAFVATCAYTGYVVYKRSKKRRTLSAVEAFKLNINVVSKSQECEALIYELRRRSMDHNAIGFDCEWVTKGGGRKPVALLQLSTFDGFCVLIRQFRKKKPSPYFLSQKISLGKYASDYPISIDNPPQSLLQLLQDISIYKVGVAPLNDANYLYQDYGMRTLSTIDLRHFAEMCGYKVGGLAYLSETLLGVILNKVNKVRCSDWDADTLSPVQVHYAASDAHAAIRIFVKLVNDLNKPHLRGGWCLPSCNDDVWEALDDVCAKYTDFNYKQVNMHKNDNGGTSKKQRKIKEPSLKSYPLPQRTKPFYDNCYLQAPDGELLSTIDNRKALWYIEKGLADRINEEPFTVRLRFEPAGRSVGTVGKYYTLKKKDQCVVCGETQSYIRKNVVPREYRKYFPEIMKEHSSHDVVLLCWRCHQRSNVRDQSVRDQLAARCRAPLLSHARAHRLDSPDAKKVRMAGRALTKQKHLLPEARRKELEAVVLNHFTDHQEVTEELLDKATRLSLMVENEFYGEESHGEAVVKYFLKEPGGLLQLEELWRKHFLTSMRPQHMPELWSVSHNLDRLRVRWNEGRLTKEQMQSMGLENFI